jgi:threonine dehydrogenase-like Zn-dependent dehydrogenase
MKLLQLEAPGRAVWREAPVPRPAAGEVLVRILAVATCPHWDLHLFAGQPMFPGMDLRFPYLPGQPGHEATGEVVAVGPDVRRLTPGCWVAVWRDTGRRPQGCYAQYNVLREEDLLEVPADLPADRVASLELAMCVEVSFQTLAVQGGIVGRTIGLAGLGPAGLVATQLARAHGAGEVIGIDPVADRRAAALRLGANRVMAPDPAAWPAGRDGPTAMDYAIDLTGVPASIEFLMDRTRRCVTLFGVLREEVRFGLRHLFGPGLALVGYADHNQAAAETALGFIQAGQLDLSALITHRLPFSRYAEAVDLLRRKEAIKVLFDPWAEG